MGITQLLSILALASALSLTWQTTSVGAPITELGRVYSVIRRLSPRLADKVAHELSRAFLSVSKHKTCKIAWPILAGVGFKESSFISRIGPTGDIGIMQVSPINVIVRKLDAKRLLTDSHYNIKSGCEILKEHQTRYKGRHPYWLGTYNAGPAKSKLALAKKYATMVRHIINIDIGYRKGF